MFLFPTIYLLVLVQPTACNQIYKKRISQLFSHKSEDSLSIVSIIQNQKIRQNHIAHIHPAVRKGYPLIHSKHMHFFVFAYLPPIHIKYTLPKNFLKLFYGYSFHHAKPKKHELFHLFLLAEALNIQTNIRNCKGFLQIFASFLLLLPYVLQSLTALTAFFPECLLCFHPLYSLISNDLHNPS